MRVAMADGDEIGSDGAQAQAQRRRGWWKHIRHAAPLVRPAAVASPLEKEEVAHVRLGSLAIRGVSARLRFEPRPSREWDEITPSSQASA